MPSPAIARTRRQTPRMGRKSTSSPAPGSPGHVIRTLVERRAGKLTNAEIAERSKLTPARLSNILTGETPNPGVVTVGRILAALGTDWCGYEKVAREISKQGNDSA